LFIPPPLERENSSDYYNIDDAESFTNSLRRFQDPEKHRAFIEEYQNTNPYKEEQSRREIRDNWTPFRSPTDSYEFDSLRKVAESIHNSKSGGKNKISRRKKRKMRKHKTHKNKKYNRNST